MHSILCKMIERKWLVLTKNFGSHDLNQLLTLLLFKDDISHSMVPPPLTFPATSFPSSWSPADSFSWRLTTLPMISSIRRANWRSASSLSPPRYPTCKFNHRRRIVVRVKLCICEAIPKDWFWKGRVPRIIPGGLSSSKWIPSIVAWWPEQNS